MRKWLAGLPVVAGYSVSAAVFSRLPRTVSLDLPPFTSAGDPVPRGAVAFLIPTVGLATWGLLLALRKVRGPVKPLPEWWLNARTGAAATRRFEPTYHTIVFSVTALILLAHLGFISRALEWPGWTRSAMTAMLGAGYMSMGHLMPRVPPNWIVGLRTRANLSDPASWARVHRTLGTGLMALGGLVVLLSFVSAMSAVLVGVVGLLPTFLLAQRLGRRPPRMSMWLVAGSLLVPVASAVPIVGLGGCAARPAADSTSARTAGERTMRLGNFSVSLAVEDLARSREFYETLGFRVAFGDQEQGWLILQNEAATIGLFQGVLDGNMMTFNPGWDRHGNPLPEFDDIRSIQRRLKERGLTLEAEADESTSGPASLMLHDPDGNLILIDQHVPRPEN